MSEVKAHFKNLDWQTVIDKLSGLATSDWARAELQKTTHLPDTRSAENSFAITAEFNAIIRSGVRLFAQSLDLMPTWLRRIERHATLKTLELKDVRHFCLECIAAKETLKTYSTPHIKGYVSRLMAADEPLSAIEQIMTPAGDIRYDASEKLFRLNEEKSQLGKQIENILNRLVRDYQLEHLLQDRFVTTREGRWVLPIKSGMQHGFQGIVHDASQSKQTVFMEPQEVVPTNNRLREVEIAIEEEIEKLLTELSQYLNSLFVPFGQSRDALLEIDQWLAKAQLMILLSAEPIAFSEDKIDLKAVRHPVLVLNNKDVISNDLQLDTHRRILLLSGPNAGGKTVLLKSVGLVAQMARSGLPVCVGAGSTLPFFSEIIVAVGDSQSVDADLSTFAAHLKKLDEAAQVSGPHALLLLDEICGSTDPEEGAALARSFIQHYSSNKVFGVITSHLGALKSGWDEGSGVVNGSLEFDQNRGPTYRFIMGVPGLSLALNTAQRVGITKAIIDRAIENLSPESQKYFASVNSLEKTKNELIDLQKKLSTEISKTEKLKAHYDSELKKFENEKAKKIDAEIEKAKKRIDDVIQESQVKGIFSRHEALQKIKHEMPEVVRYESSQTEVIQKQKLESPEDFNRLFPPGATVYIPHLGRDGVVQSAANSKGEVTLLSQSMRLVIPWQQLAPNFEKKDPTANILRRKGFAQFAPSESDRVVDVRGLTAEDALSQLEIQLDTASLQGEDRIKVIHGHGTDALKRSIRTYLSRSLYVKKWQAGNADTGGDGITWIVIK